VFRQTQKSTLKQKAGLISCTLPTYAHNRLIRHEVIGWLSMSFVSEKEKLKRKRLRAKMSL